MKNACVMRCNNPATHPPTPSASIMNPSWLHVEYASTRLMSVCTSAIVAPMNSVIAPMYAMTQQHFGREQREAAADEVHAGRDHRRRVDERARPASALPSRPAATSGAAPARSCPRTRRKMPTPISTNSQYGITLYVVYVATSGTDALCAVPSRGSAGSSRSGNSARCVPLPAFGCSYCGTPSRSADGLTRTNWFASAAVRSVRDRARRFSSSKLSVPKYVHAIRMPIRKPASPTRLTMNALFAARLALGRS